MSSLRIVIHRSHNVGLQLESSILSVKTLFTKLIEFDLASEVAAHQIFHFLIDWRFEEIPIDPRERIYLICTKEIEKHYI